MNIPNLMPFQMEAFNGDTFIQEEFLDLQKKFNIKNAVETGTCLGSTTMFLAKHFNKVVTIEVNEEYRNIALSRFKDNKDIIQERVTSLLGDSKMYIDGIIKVSELGDDTIFFLDAHWGANCPLPEELKAIAVNKIRPVIAIHDFGVPGESDRLGFDSYNGQPFTFDWLKPLFDEIYGEGQYGHHYNSDEKSTAVKRGIIYIYPAAKQSGEQPLPEVKRIEPEEELQDETRWPGEIHPEQHKIKKTPAVSLYINYYIDKNADRSNELYKTLLENIAVASIERMVVIVDHPEHVSYIKELSEKIEVVVMDHRPTYKDFFNLVNEKVASLNEISIIANSDVYITPSVAAHVKAHMKKPLCLALSTWDQLADGSYQQMKKNHNEQHFVPKNDSQDVWIFKGLIREVADCSFTLGKPGCDNAIAERLTRAGYKVCNPSNDIRPVHHHLVNVRNYDTTHLNKKDHVNLDRIPEPHLLLNPINIAQIPFVNDDVWPEHTGKLMEMFNEDAKSVLSYNNWVERIDWFKGTTGGQSQYAEDAIIDHIFNHIGSPNRFFVDLGAGAYDGSTMSNTRTLKRKGWIGFGVDAKPTKDTWVIQGFIKPETVMEIFSSKKVPMNFDFLNLDIDSSDYWVLRKIFEAGYRPRLICTEFNGTLIPDIPIALKYEKGYTWDGTNKYGYSFAAGKKLLEKYGYVIVYNLHDTDLFAVRKELIKDIHFAPVTAKAQFYHPVNPAAQWEQV